MRVFLRFWLKRLLFLVPVFCFAGQKDAFMKAKEKFEHMCSHLLEMRRYELAVLDFGKLCRQLGADECQMSNLMYARYGLSPDEVVSRLCSSWEETSGNN
jgi:hypothetical protein